MNSSRKSDPNTPDRPAAPEPSKEDQVDVASRVQEGLKEANKGSRTDSRTPPTGHKATQFDGSPNPRADEDTEVLKPADDTPAVMPKRRGPKNSE
ncbi:hypothetical protein [Achromobacter insuavis]|uniref:hypothetical protein n=1 Tax=Achromobacter insuavis TaxID=1287735 RepID=UPI000E303BBC|nr:hypothetical protein [Achromobacter insuavis]